MNSNKYTVVSWNLALILHEKRSNYEIIQDCLACPEELSERTNIWSCHKTCTLLFFGQLSRFLPLQCKPTRQPHTTLQHTLGKC